MEISVQFHFAWTTVYTLFLILCFSVWVIMCLSFCLIHTPKSRPICNPLTYTGNRLTNVAELRRKSVPQGLQCLHPLIPGNYYIRVHLSGGTPGNGDSDIRVKQWGISVGGSVCLCVTIFFFFFSFFRPRNVAALTHLISPFVPIMKTSGNWSLIRDTLVRVSTCFLLPSMWCYCKEATGLKAVCPGCSQITSAKLTSAHASIDKLWLFFTEAWKMCLHWKIIIAPCTFSSLNLTAVLRVQAAPLWWRPLDFVYCVVFDYSIYFQLYCLAKDGGKKLTCCIHWVEQLNRMGRVRCWQRKHLMGRFYWFNDPGA